MDRQSVKGSLILSYLGIASLVSVAAMGRGAAHTPALAEPNANAIPYATEGDPETLLVDASTAGRGFVISTMQIPVKPGPFTFVYPEWIPGDHGPTGPLAGISQLEVTANARALAWVRDKVDMYAFHVNVPWGVASIKVQFTVVLNAPDPVSTQNLAIINWNRVLFYQSDTNSNEVYLKASLILPPGWGYGTALAVAHPVGQRIDFNEVSLNRLVDSPVDMGRYYVHVLLWQHGKARQWLDMFADAPQDLDVPANVLAAYKRMAPEALALYGSRHWQQDYHSLLTLSSKIEFNGIEHHESSDDRTPPTFMVDPKWQLIAGDLLPHELSHSWNGKYRRPWDLYTLNYQIPQRTDLLWVYEGMNKYLGDLLSFRAGIRKPSQYPEYLALIYSAMASEPGRGSDPLIDLTTSAPYLYQAQGDYPSLRRTSEDFYVEGELLWLDVDTIIRSRTRGRRSLDAFLHLYSQPERTGPIVRTYTREDIERLLNEVAPYDWHAFFQHHVYEPARCPPTDELARSGWRLVYNAQPNIFLGADDTADLSGYQWLSYGFNVSKDEVLSDVREGSPAWRAGMSPGMKIEAVNGQAYSPDVLKYVMTEAESSRQTTAFLVSQDGWFRTIEVGYFGGPRFPHLVRIKGKPDLLGQIMAPHAGT